MKSLALLSVLSALATLPAQAADVTFRCAGRNLVLDRLEGIEWTHDLIILRGTMNGRPYILDGKFERFYSGNGYSYTTAYGKVLIPYTLINGAQAQEKVEISSPDYPNESALCTRI